MPCCIFLAWLIGLVLQAWRGARGVEAPVSAPPPPVSRPGARSARATTAHDTAVHEGELR